MATSKADDDGTAMTHGNSTSTKAAMSTERWGVLLSAWLSSEGVPDDSSGSEDVVQDDCPSARSDLCEVFSRHKYSSANQSVSKKYSSTQCPVRRNAPVQIIESVGIFQYKLSRAF